MNNTNIYLKNYKTLPGRISAFNRTDKILSGGSIFLIERHFIGNRDFRQAIYATVKNEAQRISLGENTTKTSAETA